MCLLSVVIPCYNHGAYLDEALNSLIPIRAMIGKLEVIIVDDGSTEPETIAKLDSLRKQAELIILTQANSGVGVARNTGFAKATGEFIIPLDADNALVAGTLHQRLERLQSEPTLAMVYGDAVFFGTQTGLWENTPLKHPEMLLSNQIDNCVLMRRVAWASVQGYRQDKTFQSHADWLMWLSLLSLGWGFAYVPGIFFRYRVLGTSMLRTDGKSQIKLAKIMAYAFPVQRRLAERYYHQGTFTIKQLCRVLGTSAGLLAYYQIIYGSFSQGLTCLAKSLHTSKFWSSACSSGFS